MQNLLNFRKSIQVFVACMLFVSPFLVNQTYASENDDGDTKVITGKVTEAATQSPLPGLAVVVKGTTKGTLTDIDGNYSIEAAVGDVLQFSFIGYKTVDVVVKDQTTINVEMESDIMGLDEVVVTGYGRQRKSDLTGAISSVSSEKLAEMPAVNVQQALQGRAAGVSITQNTGQPGSSTTIQIRGISSINGTQPLVIVDGVRASLDNLNPADIESVEILKDASSAAIYGSSGGNGVILVTTKKGKAGKMQVNFDYVIGSQKPWKKLDVLDASQYAECMNYIYALKGKDPFTTQPDTLMNYDWQDNMIKAAVNQNYNVSVSGGNENSTVFLSTNYQDQNGIIDKTNYKRLSFRINSDHQISKMIKVGENALFTQSKTDGYDQWVFQSEFNNPVFDILRAYPYIKPYDQNGNWNVFPTGANPVVSRDVTNRSNSTQSVGGNAYIEISPIKGLVYTSKVNAYTNYNSIDEFFPIYHYNPTIFNDRNYVSKSQTNQQGWQVQNYVNYSATILSNHNIGVMAGVEASRDWSKDMSGSRYDLINESPEMRYFDASTNDTLLTQLIHGGGWEDKMYSYFGRLNYDYMGKYLLTCNIRNDYSSRFGPKNRSGIFPSFSVGWKFSEEQFMQSLSFLSFGKLRFGYGETGANAPERYAYYPTVNSTLTAFNYIFDGSINTSSGAALQKMPNYNMHWETMIMSNVGVDLAFLNDQLTFTADYFMKENDGMLINQPLPSTVGMYQYAGHISQLGGDARPMTNIGKFKNSGVEFSLGYKDNGHAVKSSFDLNVTYVKNEVVNIQGDSLIMGSIGVNVKNFLLTAEGLPVSQFYGFQTDGLFTWDDAAYDSKGKVYIKNQAFYIKSNGDTAFAQTKAKPGDFRYVDQNGDGRLTDADKVILGSPIPKFIFGFSANFEYKNFDLTMFFEGKFGYKIFNGTKIWGMENDEGMNRLALVLDQYRDPILNADGSVLYEGNTDTDLPRLDPKGDNLNFTRPSDFFIESGNYVRLKNLQIGYTFNKELVSKLNIERVRIYAGATNLLTMTKYSGMDPEIGVSDPLQQGIETTGTYPQNRMYLLGINVQF